MDNLELKVWLELWSDEREKLLSIKRSVNKEKQRQELLANLMAVLQEKEKRRELDVIIMRYLTKKIEGELTESVGKLSELDKVIQLKSIDIIYIQEKMKIIEGKVGKELIDNERSNLLKAI